MESELRIPGFADFEVIGRGGMSTVYRAYEVSLDRVVAIKVLDARVSDAAGVRVDPAVEAVLSSLGGAIHPNVVTILRTGLDDRGSLFIVTPYYPAGSLQDRLAKRGPMDVESVLRVGVKLASAVGALHEFGILHCDIKPGNVLLDAFGEVVLSDFGIARRMSSGSGDSALALTPAYAAPELMTAGVGMSAATDVYALGTTLITLVLGRPPFGGSISDLLERARKEPATIVPPLDGGPESLRRLLLSCLDVDPARRPTALTLGEDLQGIQRELGLPVTEMLRAQRDEPAAAGPLPGARPPEPGQSGPPTIGRPRDDATRLGPLAPSAPYAPTAPPTPAWGQQPAAPGQPAAVPFPSSLPPAARTRGRGISLPSFPGLGRRRTSTGTSGHKPPRTAPVAPDSLATMAPDRPTAVDLLGQEPLVTGLGRLLDDPHTSLPLTIGISGPWGAGKSSLMLQLAAYLTGEGRDATARQWDVVHFDAWRYQGREAVWVGLARAIYEQCQGRGVVRRTWFRVRLEVRRQGAGRACAAVVLLLVGAVLGASVATRELTGGSGFVVNAGFAAAALAAVSVAVAYLGVVGQPFARALKRNGPGRAFEDFLGISHAAERDIDCLLRTVAPPGSHRAILVLLDDLDRCTPATISDTLTSVTEVFAKNADRSVAFVLGVDLDIVASAVGNALRDISAELLTIDPRRAAELREQYLEKIFQLSVTVSGHARRPISHLLLASSDRTGAGTTSPWHASPGPSSDDDRISSWMSALEEADLQNPAEATISSLPPGSPAPQTPGDLAAFRQAVRGVRASLLSVGSDDVRRAEIAVLRQLALTPRAIKRFDNAYRLQLQVANGTPGSKLGYSRDELVGVAKWVALRMFFPRVTRVIDREPGLLGELETLAGEPDTLGLSRRLQSLLPDAPPEIAAEAASLLRIEMPAAPMTKLPLDTFPSTS